MTEHANPQTLFRSAGRPRGSRQAGLLLLLGVATAAFALQLLAPATPVEAARELRTQAACLACAACC